MYTAFCDSMEGFLASSDDGEVRPLFEVWAQNGSAATSPNVGCLSFVTPSLLAAGDAAGAVSLIDLLSRRLVASFSAAAGLCYIAKSSSSAVCSSISSISNSGSRHGSRKSAFSWEHSPLLHLAVVSNDCCSQCKESPVIATAACADIIDGEVYAPDFTMGATEADSEAGAEAAPPPNTRVSCVSSSMLTQQKSSLISLWDLHTLKPCCQFTTGSYSFCKLAVLQQQHQWLNSRAPAALETISTSQAKDEFSDVKQVHLKGSSTGVGDTPGNLSSPLLLAAPVADVEAFGLFDIRCCAKMRISLSCSSTSSKLREQQRMLCSIASASAKPVVTFKPVLSPSSLTPVAASAAGGSLGMVQALSAVPTKEGMQQLLAAAYESPSLTLWDPRQPKEPLSIAALSRSDAAAAAATPSCLALFRHQCWVGSFEGDLWALKLHAKKRVLSSPYFYTNVCDSHTTAVVSPFISLHSSSSADAAAMSPDHPSASCTTATSAVSHALVGTWTKRYGDLTGLSEKQQQQRYHQQLHQTLIAELPHPEGDLGVPRALLSAAFRPDGAIIAVGAADGSVCLFEGKSNRLLGKLHHQQHGGVKALAWCSSSGALATAAGGRISLWGVYTDTYPAIAPEGPYRKPLQLQQ